MEKVYFFRLDTKQVVATDVKVADTFIKRLIGRIFKQFFKKDEGFLITKTKQVYHFCTRFSIDVIYLKEYINCTYEVVHIKENMGLWNLIQPVSLATDMLEVKNGVIKKNNIKVGDIIIKNKLF